MKTSLLSLLLCLALAGIAHAVGNPVNIGYGLANQCRVATQAGGTGALPPPAWKCLSYIDGWLEGLDGALVTDDNGVLQTVAVGDGVTAIQAAADAIRDTLASVPVEFDLIFFLRPRRCLLPVPASKPVKLKWPAAEILDRFRQAANRERPDELVADSESGGFSKIPICDAEGEGHAASQSRSMR